MDLLSNHTYHIYNQGNRRQEIFYKQNDYLRFLTLTRKYILPYCNILSYCLMPNHFHFLIHTTEESISPKKIGNIMSTQLSNGFRMLQSSYAQVVNTELGEYGSLFKQKAKAKLIDETSDHLFHAFTYVHQNPLVAGLVTSVEEWEYSSYLDFEGLRNGTLCNIELAMQLLGLTSEELFAEVQKPLSEKIIQSFY